jgi:cell division protein FtsL
MTPVIQTDVGHKKGVGVWAFALALLTAGALVHVAVRMHGIQIAYELGRERRTNTELEERRRRLNIEIGMLKDPGRVIGLARDKLQMGPPAPGNVVRLDPGVVLASGGRP